MLEQRKGDLYPSRVAAVPQILARHDPVVHGHWSPDAALSRKQTESFRKDGFLVLEDTFDVSEIELLQSEATRLRSSPRQSGDETVITEPESGAVRSVFQIHQQSSLFARLAADARLVQIAQFLLGDDVYIHQSRLNYKPGFQGKEFYWHSDFETWHVEDGMPRMRALSMSILLNENTPANGPTMFMAGSHNRFVACVGETPDNHYKQSLKKQEYGVPDDESLRVLSGSGIAAPTGKAGTVVIFDCNTMHGSNSNITPLPRSNAFFVFNAASNKLTSPFGSVSAPRPEFVAARENTPIITPIDGPFQKDAA